MPTDRGSRVPKIIEGKIEVDFRIWRIVIILPRVQGWKMQVGSKALRFYNRGYGIWQDVVQGRVE